MIFKYLDLSQLAMLFLGNFMFGFNNFMDIVLMLLYKDFLGHKLEYVDMYMGIVAIPRSLLMLYGLISDNIEICGSKRRGHILVNIISGVIVVLVLIVFNYNLGNILFTVLFFIQSLNTSYIDAVTDGMAVQAANNPKLLQGPKKMQTFCFIAMSIGAISGSLFATVKLLNFTEPLHNLKVYLGLQVLLLITAINMDVNSEPQVELIGLNETQTLNLEDSIVRLIESEDEEIH